jgi:predicted DNA binding CopG/RHH family protein
MKGYVKTDTSRREINWAKAVPVVLPNLKPSSTAISIRLPNSVLARLKREAHRRGVPYQSYIKTRLAEIV